MNTFSLDAEEFHYEDGVLTFHLTNGDKITTDGPIMVAVRAVYTDVGPERNRPSHTPWAPPVPEYEITFNITAHVSPAAEDNKLFTLYQHSKNWGK